MMSLTMGYVRVSLDFMLNVAGGEKLSALLQDLGWK